MASDTHCDDCRRFLDARAGSAEAFEEFAVGLAAAIGRVAGDEPAFASWLADLRRYVGPTGIPANECVVTWAERCLRAFASDKHRDYVSRWLSGDPDAFEMLFVLLRDGLVARARRLIGDLAEDLVDQVFTEVFEEWSNGRCMYMPHRSPFTTYMAMRVTSKAHSSLRRTSRGMRLEAEHFGPEVAPTRAKDSVGLSEEAILTAVDTAPLAPAEREVFTLASEGVPGTEIASALGLSEATVSRRYATAAAKIVSRLRQIAHAADVTAALRSMAREHKQRASALFLHYALPEIGDALERVGRAPVRWPKEELGAADAVAEIFINLPDAATADAARSLILDHAREPWGVRLREALARVGVASDLIV